jgi:hypothetical protein
MPTPHKFGSDQNAMIKTDPNSVYRQVFNRDLSFFLFVIERIDPPIHIKLHLTTLVPNELTDAEVIHSMRVYLKSIDDMRLGPHRQQIQQQQVDNQVLSPANDGPHERTSDPSTQTSIEVKQFSNKQQIKIFIKLYDGDKERAKLLFQKLYKASEIPIYDENGEVKFNRKMRAYLIKDEGTMEQLAQAKFFDDLKKKQV